MTDQHRVALPDKRHFGLPGAPLVGETVTANGKAFHITGVGLREFVGQVARVTWPAELVDIASIDENLTWANEAARR